MSGRKRGLGSGVHPSRRNYRCKVPGCSATPRGCDLARHYKRHTDWSKVKELKSVFGSEALREELEELEGHTRFAYVNNYTEENLPTWITHAPVPVPMDASHDTDGESSGPKQTKLFDHFKVKIFVYISYL